MKQSKQLTFGPRLLDDLSQSLKTLEGWGSVEIFVQNNKITQISARKIKKTNHSVKSL